ncbi:MAG TPA: squalene synthase HpnC [Methylocella sp.]|nr:squalene synthase HpnC [Methylocella sp.]
MKADLLVKPTKTHKGENFPVASLLIAPKHRAAILAYYRFARAADDVADSPSLTPDDKLAGLDLFEATLLGHCDTIKSALPLRVVLAERKLPPRHALDLLRAFRMDAVKQRYADWSELMNYCAYSAAPVGRFVLDVHGESEVTWPASDALCTALQIINHLQDCGADYRKLNRIYIPQDVLAAQGLGAEALGAAKASPALRMALHETAQRNAPLVAAGAKLPQAVRDFRLCLETAVIAQLARRLNSFLLERDPLSEDVHLTRLRSLIYSGFGVAQGLRAFLRLRRVAATQAGGA